jgi:hypothetical protein
MKKFNPDRTCAIENGRETWVYKNRKEHFLAIKAIIYGFNLSEFDTWLMEFEECEAKEELIERRKAAVNASDQATLKAHLEFLNLQWYYIRRVGFLFPFAKIGDESQANKTKANIKSIKIRQAKADEESERILALYNKMLAEFEKKDQTLLYSHVIREYEKLHGVKITDYKIRNAIAKTKLQN